MMDSGTYGLGTSIRGPAAAGPGLASLGQQQEGLATKLLGQAADEEQRRNLENQQRAQQEKQAKTQLGTTVGAVGGAALGAQYGSVGGPWGMAIGALVGALGSQLF